MTAFFGIGFLAPALLWALAALPVLWWLLRAVPPAPLRRRFPAVVLLLGLEDRETTPDRTPWWLLLLRMVAVAAAILAFAQPVLNPTDRARGSGPLLIALDASWASAQTWRVRQAKLAEVVSQAEQDGRPVAIVRLTDRPRGTAGLPFTDAGTAGTRLDGLVPNAWAPDYDAWIALIESADGFDTLWLSDGLDHPGRAILLDALSAQGSVEVGQPDGTLLALNDVRVESGALIVTGARTPPVGERSFTVTADGPDPSGITRSLARQDGGFEAAASTAAVSMDQPSELRNRVTRVAIDGVRSAGAVQVTDDAIQRRKVALLGGAQEQEGARLVSPLHFLRKALVTTAEVIEADLSDTLQASPDVIVMADVAELGEAETAEVARWVEEGGHLLRFAGPRLASSGIGQRDEHPLLPVRLRAGGRSVGGAMSWGEPKALMRFEDGSPFFGLSVPEDVLVTSQVVAQPDPNLADRVLASLADGTPLVTAKDMGSGRVVLFHVTANADWSSLPLSGLFVQMLERLAISTRTGGLSAEELEGSVWVPEQVLDGFGVLRDAPGLAGVDGARLASRDFAADMPPGVYANGDRRVALNALGPGDVPTAAQWPASTSFIAMESAQERPLQPWLLMLAVTLLCVDILATLWLGGRLQPRMAGVALAAMLAAMAPGALQAQTDAEVIDAANNTVLAYVVTGDRQLDRLSQEGLTGLSSELFRRTSVEPIAPKGVDIERDELSIYPFLYWPVSDTQGVPSAQAIAKLNAFLRGGGMIMFDTRDANVSGGFGTGTPNGRALQQIARQLEVPPLEPVPDDHVLTRAFYLLQDFPGRYANSRVWVEAAPPDAEQVEGMPFRNLNDGVTPVIIGGNDWAAAWAMNENGQFLYPVGRGATGERQREIAFRFGVNLIMHVLTGNYKSDQVHVPALLDRLGQ
ncbi:MAG: DUF4159 domain-containing protein [Pseudomonadota bacterium]